MRKKIQKLMIMSLILLFALSPCAAATGDEVTNAIVTPTTQDLVNSNTTLGGDDQFVVSDTPAQGFPTNGSSYANINTGSSGWESLARLTLNLTIPEGAQTLSFNWMYATNEGQNSYFNDWASGEIFDGSTYQNILYADTTAPVVSGSGIGYGWATPMQTVIFDVSAYTGSSIILEFSVSDVGDTVVNSALFIDNLHIGPAADLAITKIVNNTAPLYKSTIEYVLNATNNGPQDAENVSVTDLLPAGLQFVSADGAYDSNTGKWTIGTLGAGESVLLKIVALVNAVGEMTNNSTITSDAYDYDTTNNMASSLINVPAAANLYTETSVDKTNPNVGDTVKITFKVGNTGPSTAEDTILTFVLPDGLKFISANADQGTATYNEVSRLITWNMGDVPVGDPYLYVLAEVTKSGAMELVSSVSSSTFEVDPADNVDALTINAASKTVTAKSTVGMQKTGIPLPLMVLAILMVLSGLFVSNRK